MSRCVCTPTKRRDGTIDDRCRAVTKTAAGELVCAHERALAAAMVEHVHAADGSATGEIVEVKGDLRGDASAFLADRRAAGWRIEPPRKRAKARGPGA